MTPDLYQCQYEKATKCAMDEPCLGCETHAKYAKVAKDLDLFTRELNISITALEWRREVFYNQHPIYAPELDDGRALLKSEVVADTEININFIGIHAVSVNGTWYKPVPMHHAEDLNNLWEKLKK